MNNIEIIEIYSKIMCDLLLLFDSSEVRTLDNAVPTLYNCVNIITYIFHMCLDKPHDKVLYICQNACVYYFEYIDQIRKSDITKNLPISDIAIFLLKQVESDSKPLIQENHINEMVSGPNDLVKNMNYIMHILMAWENTMDLKVRIVICSTYLAEYCNKFSDELEHLDYINAVVRKVTMRDDLYYHFLGVYYKKYLKCQKKGINFDTDIMRLYSYLQNHGIKQFADEESVETFVQQLYK